jgi:UDP-glucose 4-epimerase
MTDPVFDLDVNTRDHLALLEELRARNPNTRVVFTSTRQLFGRPRYLPVDEDHPVDPVDVNGITKYAAEQFHLLYGECYGLSAAVVRLTNVYGPRQRLRDDFQGFLPIFVRHALLGEPIPVFGDGAQQRDCLHVDDVVECLLRAAYSPDAPGQVFNVGNDEHLALRDLAQMIIDAAGSGSVEFVPWPPDRDAIDIGSYFGDSSKAKRLLGWEPEIPFLDGIQRTIEFYRHHPAWYRSARG